MGHSRRDFGRLALAGLPGIAALSLPGVASAKPNSKIRGVTIGAQSYSLRQGVPKNELVAAYVKIGLSDCELMSGDAEAMAGAPPAPVNAGGGGRGRGRGPLTPEQQAAQAERQKAMSEYQKTLGEWRSSATEATWAPVKRQFKDAGVNLRILCYNLSGQNITDADIENGFKMARALDVKTISSSSTVSIAKRVAPFADKYKIVWAGHGHDNTADPEQFAKPETFEMIMSLSPYIWTNLDVGHFVAANYDPIPFIQKHHGRIANVHLKDRKKDHGPNTPWGEGDTPLKEVLHLMRKEKYPFPANIEMEYQIPQGSDAIAEVGKCYAYARQILES